MAKLKSKAKGRRARKGLTDAQADRITKQFEKSAASIDKAGMDQIEENISTFDVHRRTMLATMTRSGRQLMDVADSDPGRLAFASVLIDDYVKRTSEFIEELAKPAALRVRLALCQVDGMERVLADARTKYESTFKGNQSTPQAQAAVAAVLRLVVDNTKGTQP